MLAAVGRERLDTVPCLALSVLASTAVYPLLILLLYILSIPLVPQNVTLGTDALLTVLATAVGLRHHYQCDVPVLAWRGSFHAMATVTALGIIIFIPALIGLKLFPPPAQQAYTQFYLAGHRARVVGMARVNPRHPLVVALGIANYTHRRQIYRIVPIIDGVPDLSSRSIVLAAGHIWTGKVAGRVPADGCVHQVRFDLLRPSHHGRLGRLTLWAEARGLSTCRKVGNR